MIDGELPSPMLTVAVRDWFAWTPGRETRADWLAWAGRDVAAVATEPMPALPMMLRRRATPIGQKVLGAALACQGSQEARYVLASRHGEFDRTVTILTSLAENEQPSPAEFSMSVHHGLAGLLSIHTGNRQGHIAVAASLDTFGYGLLEAAACLHESPEQPVLFVYFDGPLPDSYAPFRLVAEADLPLVVALTLSADGEDRISVGCAAADRNGAADSLPQGFLKFLLTNAVAATGIGEEMTWRWRRAA
nr:beta-ketoacyl synthase chain length factor [uncultured Dongia sp.]